MYTNGLSVTSSVPAGRLYGESTEPSGCVFHQWATHCCVYINKVLGINMEKWVTGGCLWSICYPASPYLCFLTPWSEQLSPATYSASLRSSRAIRLQTGAAQIWSQEPIQLHSVVKNSIQAAKVWLTHTGSPFWRCWENRGHIHDWNYRIWDLNTLLSFNMVHFPTNLDPKPTGLTTGLRTEISPMTFKSQSDWKWIEENVSTPAHYRYSGKPVDSLWPQLFLEHTCEKYHFQNRNDTTKLGDFYTTIFPRISCNWSQQKSQDLPVICRNC